MNAQERSRRNARLRRTLLRAFVWFLLAGFILTSVGVTLFNFAR